MSIPEEAAFDPTSFDPEDYPKGHLCLPRGKWVAGYGTGLCSNCSWEYLGLHQDRGFLEFEKAWEELQSMGADYSLGELPKHLRMVPPLMEVLQFQAAKIELLREQVRNLVALNQPKEPYGMRDIEPWQG